MIKNTHSQQGFAKIALIVAIVLALIGALGYVAWRNFVYEEPVANQTTTQPADETDEPNTKSDATAAPIESATLLAVGDYTGSGGATRTFSDGIFAHAVTASIGDPADGKFYEGWLVNNGEFFSTGKLTKSGDAYELTYTANKNYPDHNLVVITEETIADGLDNKPEAHVLEGKF